MGLLYVDIILSSFEGNMHDTFNDIDWGYCCDRCEYLISLSLGDIMNYYYILLGLGSILDELIEIFIGET